MSVALKEPENALTVRAGFYQVCDDSAVTMVARLGMGLAACMYDPYAGVGGMTHFLLPGNADDDAACRFGVQRMELLINSLLRIGGQRERIVVRLYGGAKYERDGVDIGEQNALFAENFLEAEGIPQAAGSLRNKVPIFVEFRPTLGKAKFVPLPDEATEIFDMELMTMARPAPVQEDEGDLELF
jgi:chemotaxis protein CheD